EGRRDSGTEHAWLGAEPSVKLVVFDHQTSPHVVLEVKIPADVEADRRKFPMDRGLVPVHGETQLFELIRSALDPRDHRTTVGRKVQIRFRPTLRRLDLG